MVDEVRKARLELVTGGKPRTDVVHDSEDRRVTKRGAISRDRILDAAMSLLAEGGYPAISISAVCKRAEVSAASLYHHFGDKAGLMEAMIEDSIVLAANRFLDLMSSYDHPLDQIGSYIETMRALGRDYRGNTIGVLASLAQGCSESPEMAKAIQGARARAWRFVAAEMGDHFGVEDGMMFAHLQFAFATYIIHVAQSTEGRDEINALYDSLHRFLILLIAALRPDFAKDPRFAAALAEASRDRPFDSTENDKAITQRREP